MSAKKVTAVCLEGLPGVGKTTILKQCEAAFKNQDWGRIVFAEFAEDAMQRSGLTQAAYENLVDQSILQLTIFIDRMHALYDAIHKGADVVLMDVSPFTCLNVFADRHLSGKNLTAYYVCAKRMFETLAQMVEHVEFVFAHLDIDVTTAMQRQEQQLPKAYMCETQQSLSCMMNFAAANTLVAHLVWDCKQPVSPSRKITTYVQTLEGKLPPEFLAGRVGEILKKKLAEYTYDSPSPTPSTSSEEEEDNDRPKYKDLIPIQCYQATNRPRRRSPLVPQEYH